MYLTLPKLIEVSKKHYNCDKIIGVELENEGSKGSAGSHFERRTLGNEVRRAYDHT